MMVDFHSHILPGIDDGSDCVDTSLKMLALEKAQGITHVVATPHFYPNRDNPAAFLARRAKAMEALAARMTPELPQVIPGAEVAFFRGMSQSEALVDLTLGKSKFLLVELPPAPWPEEVYRELAMLQVSRGLTPVVAHIDRYITRWNYRHILPGLAGLPIQANGEFFCNPFTAAFARRLLEEGVIHLLGSDCHNLSDRKPNLGPVLEKIRKKSGPKALEALDDCQGYILQTVNGVGR
jgi:protein-tyrosine phosphatase